MRLGSNDPVPNSLLWILSSTGWIAFVSRTGYDGGSTPIAITILAAWILLASRIPKVLSRPAFVPV
jgi:hypothetical protein